MLTNDVHRLFAGGGQDGSKAGRLDDVAQGFARAGIVVGDQDRVGSLLDSGHAASPRSDRSDCWGDSWSRHWPADPIRTAGGGREQTAYRGRVLPGLGVLSPYTMET